MLGLAFGRPRVSGSRWPDIIAAADPHPFSREELRASHTGPLSDAGPGQRAEGSAVSWAAGLPEGADEVRQRRLATKEGILLIPNRAAGRSIALLRAVRARPRAREAAAGPGQPLGHAASGPRAGASRHAARSPGFRRSSSARFRQRQVVLPEAFLPGTFA
jgi:hypothetical protein